MADQSPNLPHNSDAPAEDDAREVSLEEIARRAGVSAGTVSRVLNGKNKENRPSTVKRSQRIRSIAAELGYRPNAAARTMSTGRSGNVALITCGTIGFDWLPSPLLHGIHRGLAANGMRMVLSDVPAQRFDEAGFVPHLLREAAVDGLLIHADGQLPQTAMPFFEGQRPPCVWINRDVPYRAVIPDELNGAERAVDFLAGRGHERIGYFRLSDPLQIARHYSIPERRDGFAQAMKKRGLKATVALEETGGGGHGYNRTPARIARAVEYLKANKGITAAVAYELEEASALCSAAGRLGMKLPEDLEIVAFHPAEIASEAALPVATAVVPFREVGQACVEMLIEAMPLNARRYHHGEPPPPETQRVPFRRVEGEDALGRR